jgi:hypothetical protein
MARLNIRQLSCGFLALVAVSTYTAFAAPVKGSCSPTKVDYSASVVNGQRTSDVFGNIPEAAINFVQGGNSPSCVIVKFSAVTFGDQLLIRALLDGVAVPVPDEVLYSSGDSQGDAHSFYFVFPSVAPGNHTIRMQYRLANTPGAAIVQRHTTLVEHR